MTTIAWDGKTLAADRLAAYGSLATTITKIYRIDGLLVGGSGESSLIGMMVEWVRGGRQISAFPATQRDKDDWQPLLVVERDGSTSVYERTPHPIRHEQKFIAIGSGRDFAMAAMHLGRTAREALEVACALDVSSGHGIDTLELL